MEPARISDDANNAVASNAAQTATVKPDAAKKTPVVAPSALDDLDVFVDDEGGEDEVRGSMKLVAPTPAAIEKISNDLRFQLNENQGEVRLCRICGSQSHFHISLSFVPRPLSDSVLSFLFLGFFLALFNFLCV